VTGERRTIYRQACRIAGRRPAHLSHAREERSMFFPLIDAETDQAAAAFRRFR
jgi:hypothetical protein